VAETVPEGKALEQRAQRAGAARRGCAVVLWLFAVLIAEVEALLWLFERTYAQ
jgi:hypothetical protein